MSRRSRRRSGKPKGKGIWWIRGTIIFFSLAILIMAGGYLWLRAWLHSEEFRMLLSLRASEALNAEAEFGDFTWDGSYVSTRSFTASGDGAVSSFEAHGLSMDIGMDRLNERILELRNARINTIDLEMDLRGDALADDSLDEPELDEYEEPAWYQKWIPNDFRLTGLEILQSAVTLKLDDGDVRFSGTSWELQPGDAPRTYEVTASDGNIDFPWSFAPSLRLEDLKIRNSEDEIFLTDSNFRLYNRGVLRLTGASSLDGEDYSLNGVLESIRAEEILSEDWLQKLTGKVEAEFSVVDGPVGPVVQGSVSLLDGTLTGLRILDSLGAYGGNPRFRRLVLSEAATDFMWEDGNLVLTRFRLGSEGLMRVQGRIKVDKEDHLDGNFRVGLTPGTLALIPGAETKVFLPGERGLLWTTVRISGTVDNPKEDLTERLILAAGMRMFEIIPETGERVLKYSNRTMSTETLKEILGEDGIIQKQGRNLLETGKGILDENGDLIPGANDVIRQGTDVARDVGGIFGILGGGDDLPSGDTEDERQEP